MCLYFSKLVSSPVRPLKRIQRIANSPETSRIEPLGHALLGDAKTRRQVGLRRRIGGKHVAENLGLGQAPTPVKPIGQGKGRHHARCDVFTADTKPASTPQIVQGTSSRVKCRSIGIRQTFPGPDPSEISQTAGKPCGQRRAARQKRGMNEKR